MITGRILIKPRRRVIVKDVNLEGKYKTSTLGPLFPANKETSKRWDSHRESLRTIYRFRLSEFLNNDTQFYSVVRHEKFKWLFTANDRCKEFTNAIIQTDQYSIFVFCHLFQIVANANNGNNSTSMNPVGNQSKTPSNWPPFNSPKSFTFIWLSNWMIYFFIIRWESLDVILSALVRL